MSPRNHKSKNRPNYADLYMFNDITYSAQVAYVTSRIYYIVWVLQHELLMSLVFNLRILRWFLKLYYRSYNSTLYLEVEFKKNSRFYINFKLCITFARRRKICYHTTGVIIGQMGSNSARLLIRVWPHNLTRENCTKDSLHKMR